MHITSFIRSLRVASVLALATAALAALAADKVVWRLGHTLTVPGTLYEKIIVEEVPARIAKATGGAVQVQPIIGVVKTNDVISALQQGRVEMGDLTVAYSAATYPTWAVLNLPGLVDDQRLIAPIARRIVVPAMAEDMKQWGIRPVVTLAWIGGSYFSNKKITSAADFVGTKWRTHAPMLSKLITEVGGATIGMPFEELYPSLERRLVDSYTTTYPAMYSAKLYKVTKYAVAAPNGTSLAILMVGEQALANLSQDLRTKVLAELEAINKEVGERLYNESLEVVKNLKAAGVEVITLPRAENDKLIAASKKAVWTEWRAQAGEKGDRLIKEIEAFKP